MIPSFVSPKHRYPQHLTEKTPVTPQQALRELIRRALKGDMAPDAYLQAVQLIREHGDMGLGPLFKAFNKVDYSDATKPDTVPNDK